MAAQKDQNTSLKPGAPQNMSTKIGRNAADLAKPCFPAGTSRVSRSRAARALGLRKRKPVSPQSPPSPNQESAMNSRTGKVAFGPWQGPYETVLSSSETLFLDANGNTYTSLSAVQLEDDTAAVPDKRDKQQQQKQPQAQLPQQPAGKDSPATAATQQLYVMMNKVMQRAAAAAAANPRQPAQWLGRSKAHSGGRCNTTMGRAINQPRKN